MANYILRQGTVTANLFDITYRQSEGFFEDHAWHASEATITAESDTKLTAGPGAILHDDQSYAVTVTVWEFGVSDDEEEESTFTIDIDHPEGAARLASALGLVEDGKPKAEKRRLP